MKNIKIDDNYYEIIKNYKDGYNEEEFKKNAQIIFMNLIISLATGHMESLD